MTDFEPTPQKPEPIISIKAREQVDKLRRYGIKVNILDSDGLRDLLQTLIKDDTVKDTTKPIMVTCPGGVFRSADTIKILQENEVPVFQFDDTNRPPGKISLGVSTDAGNAMILKGKLTKDETGYQLEPDIVGKIVDSIILFEHDSFRLDHFVMIGSSLITLLEKSQVNNINLTIHIVRTAGFESLLLGILEQVAKKE